jgi:aldehyde:ferredoxin oxidoreductase
MNGWTGRALRVDLTARKYDIEDLDPEALEKFIGGRGLGVKILFDELDQTVDPCAPENKLIFVSGPLVGTGAITGSSCDVVTKSPLTGTVGCAKTRGHFGAELKFSGFDGIIVEGRSETPVILAILDDKISIQPAIEYWGRTTSETEILFKRNLGDKWAARETYLLSIGPAGERQVPLATIINDGFLSVGGAGAGAVMGSKNLKAIAVKGQHSLSVADGGRFLQVVTTLINKLNSSPMIAQSMSVWGSAFLVGLCYQKGILPENNFQGGFSADIRNLGTKALSSAFALRGQGCFACPIACIKKTDVKHPLFKGRGMAPTYLAIGSLGMNCGVSDLEAIGIANMLCAEMGLDPVATGGTLATAMELMEKGVVSKEDLNVDLRFGQAEDIAQALRTISTRPEHAGHLCRGGEEIANVYNRPDLFMGVKGYPLAPFDPRAIQGMGLHFATCNLGPHHIYAYTFIDELLNVHEKTDPWTIEGKPELVKKYQETSAIMDSLGLCNWPLMGLKIDNFVPMVNSCMGTSYKAEDLLLKGERIWNLERLFSLAAGIDHSKDTLPERFLKEEIHAGPAEGQVNRLNEMLPEYYRIRGWNDRGEPLPETLQVLEIEG